MFYVGMYSFLPVLGSLLFLCVLLFTNYYFISVGYLAWMFYDINILDTSRRGGRRMERIRNSKVMKYFRDYFPVKLHTTAKLDHNKNYIIASHPHGIIGCGTLINFASNITGFSKQCPGIRCHPTTIQMNFRWPFIREILLWFGEYNTVEVLSISTVQHHRKHFVYSLLTIQYHVKWSTTPPQSKNSSNELIPDYMSALGTPLCWIKDKWKTINLCTVYSFIFVKFGTVWGELGCVVYPPTHPMIFTSGPPPSKLSQNM